MIAKNCVFFRWSTEVENGIAKFNSTPYCNLFKVDLNESHCLCNDCQYFKTERRSYVDRRQKERRLTGKNEK